MFVFGVVFGNLRVRFRKENLVIVREERYKWWLCFLFFFGGILRSGEILIYIESFF